MVSYLWYKKCLDRFVESEHPRDEDGKFTDTNSNSPKTLGDILKENKNNSFSSRRIENGVKKIHLPEKEATKCAEAIEEYTRNMFTDKTDLINKAIYNSDSYNEKTYSGIEKEFDADLNVGDEIGGRLISWSKSEDVAKDFAQKSSKKILIIDKNPGLDISDISYEPEEQEVLTATTMSFVVTDIQENNGFKKIFVKYTGNKGK